MESHWNKWVCPCRDVALNDEEKSWVTGVASVVHPGKVAGQEPEGWRTLSCGHRTEVIIDKSQSPDGFKFLLRCDS